MEAILIALWIICGLIGGGYYYAFVTHPILGKHRDASIGDFLFSIVANGIGGPVSLFVSWYMVKRRGAYGGWWLFYSDSFWTSGHEFTKEDME